MTFFRINIALSSNNHRQKRFEAVNEIIVIRFFERHNFYVNGSVFIARRCWFEISPEQQDKIKKNKTNKNLKVH